MSHGNADINKNYEEKSFTDSPPHKRPHAITKRNDNRYVNNTIAGSMNILIIVMQYHYSLDQLK